MFQFTHSTLPESQNISSLELRGKTWGLTYPICGGMQGWLAQRISSMNLQGMAFCDPRHCPLDVKDMEYHSHTKNFNMMVFFCMAVSRFAKYRPQILLYRARYMWTHSYLGMLVWRAGWTAHGHLLYARSRYSNLTAQYINLHTLSKGTSTAIRC